MNPVLKNYKTVNKQNVALYVVMIWISASSCLSAQTAKETFINPIIPGFHPDPSICRVGEDYYLVNSTFEWFPGIPVYHSRDLVNWELIGHGIHRPGQVDLPEGLGDSRGVYAATLRFHDGTFYIINTCVNCNGNFYITATDPAGPWSDPVWLPTRGIDPSLFWDDDGRSYYVGHANITGKNDWPNKNGAWIQEIDLEHGKLLGEPVQLTHGHAANARWTEGPHIFKIDGRYLLMVAEGGTGFHHAVTIHESENLMGPYIPNHANPVLTHRHLGYDYPIHSVGHADLVRTQNGEWWSVMLGKRKVDGYTLLARETFLAKVDLQYQEGMLTPVFNRGIGRLLEVQDRPDLPWNPVPPLPATDDFEEEKLALHWNFLRTPLESWHQIGEGSLKLQLRPQVVDSLVNPSLVARRIQHHAFQASTALDFSTRKENEVAGLILYRMSKNHFQLVKNRDHIVLVRTSQGEKQTIAKTAYKESTVILEAEADGLQVQFRFGPTGDQMQDLGPAQPMHVLSDEKCGGFNGPYVGMYATSNGQASKSSASFEWFNYKGTEL
jgi:alpha-N-arabinofuranosidase